MKNLNWWLESTEYEISLSQCSLEEFTARSWECHHVCGLCLEKCMCFYAAHRMLTWSSVCYTYTLKKSRATHAYIWNHKKHFLSYCCLLWIMTSLPKLSTISPSPIPEYHLYIGRMCGQVLKTSSLKIPCVIVFWDNCSNGGGVFLSEIYFSSLFFFFPCLFLGSYFMQSLVKR